MNVQGCYTTKRPINEQIDKNIETIIMAMEEASENHVDILLLPECFITGYDLPMSYEKKCCSGSVTSGNSRERIRISTLRTSLKSIFLIWRTDLEKVRLRIKDMCLT